MYGALSFTFVKHQTHVLNKLRNESKLYFLQNYLKFQDRRANYFDKYNNKKVLLEEQNCVQEYLKDFKIRQDDFAITQQDEAKYVSQITLPQYEIN